jgi:FAD:protein FMN transferase
MEPRLSGRRYEKGLPAPIAVGPMPPSAEDLVCQFRAMATPCEVRIETADTAEAESVFELVEAEALRIERKFSRYRDDNIVAAINGAKGRAIELDAETAQLIDFADFCFTTSSGRFDVTSGVLRKVWKFDGSDNVPSRKDVNAVRKNVGWQRVRWNNPVIEVPDGMEIDFGGIGKEYAVDRALEIALEHTRCPVLVNFGGDLRVSGPRISGEPWQVAIESVDSAGAMAGLLQVSHGALATSGDARRFLMKNGIRYSHILDPRTGMPVKDPPRSVTVAAPTCLEAGMFSTFAMLQGRNAERFLKREGVRAWCIR